MLPSVPASTPIDGFSYPSPPLSPMLPPTNGWKNGFRSDYCAVVVVTATQTDNRTRASTPILPRIGAETETQSLFARTTAPAAVSGNLSVNGHRLECRLSRRQFQNGASARIGTMARHQTNSG